MPLSSDNPLGTFLKDRRARLDPATLGIVATRRRTPGLRREEIAQRANVSVTWYTWLEQGRGGAPSADVLDRVARALTLTEVEREHMFLLAQHRPPQVRYQAHAGVTPRLQNVIDGMRLSPAIIKTSAWDIVAWNQAATAVLKDYSTLPPQQRNILRILFGDTNVRSKMPHWQEDARGAVASFRLEVSRTGASEAAEALVADLCASSPEFAAMWRDNDVQAYGEGTKRVNHPVVGPLALDYSTFGVDGAPDLGLVVYTPATSADAVAVDRLIALSLKARQAAAE